MADFNHARRVVVTGMGVISPVGLDTPTAWQNVVAGKSGIGRITLFNTDDMRVKIAGEAWGFNPTAYMSPKEARRADRNVQFAIAAAKQALAQAKLKIADANADDVGVLIGSGAAGIWTYTTQQAIMDAHGPQRLSPLLIPMITVDSASVQVSILTGARGPSYGIASACSTGVDSIGEAFEIIRRGDAEAMIAGGTEAAVHRLGIGGFDQLGALSRRNEAPAEACRPFDLRRDGFVLSEGAGVVILEALERALARGAEPLAEVLAYAATSDAAHLTNPDKNAVQAGRAITRVLQKAGVKPEEVDYINAHGTWTQLGDLFEVRAIKNALGEAAYRVPISSTKSTTGHLLGGAGAVEAIWCVMALREGLIPPTINYFTPDPQCDLDFVPNIARRADPSAGFAPAPRSEAERAGRGLRIVLSNAFGFGGHNTILLLKRWE